MQREINNLKTKEGLPLKAYRLPQKAMQNVVKSNSETSVNNKIENVQIILKSIFPLQ
jgi:hypothetical protein